ncbi:hypothetical protein V6Z11_1Z133100 [Gossypium hirsutum]
MIHKRPYTDDSQEVACKHMRQCEDTVHFASFVDVHPNYAFQNHQISEGKWEDIYTGCQDEGRFAEDQCNNVHSGTNKDYESGASAYAEANVAVHLPLFPEYFASGKPISVGPEYQADIPEWSQQDMNSSLDYLDTSDPQVALRSSCAGLMVDDDYGKKMMGTCVIPMPNSEATLMFCFEDARHGIDCDCLDRGSIRCIGQHVTEAREKLRGNLGWNYSGRWTEGEELAFDNVVLSNPFSLGKNFWDHLTVVLPSRTKKEAISYYFNVFMLRKPECGIPAGDDDSVVESPTGHETAAHYENNDEEDCHEDIENDYDNEHGVDSSEMLLMIFVNDITEEEDEGDIDEISRHHVERFIDNYSCSDFQLVRRVKGNNEDDYNDLQDDSCTSYEYQGEQVDSHGLPETAMDANQPSLE